MCVKEQKLLGYNYCLPQKTPTISGRDLSTNSPKFHLGAKSSKMLKYIKYREEVNHIKKFCNFDMHLKPHTIYFVNIHSHLDYLIIHNSEEIANNLE